MRIPPKGRAVIQTGAHTTGFPQSIPQAVPKGPSSPEQGLDPLPVPQATSKPVKTFEIEVLVRFGDVDAAGIAYFPSIYNMMHDTFEDLWTQHVGVPYAELLMKQRLGFPLVRSEVDFSKPLHFGDRPRVVVTCQSVGRSSLRLRYRFFLGDVLALDARMTTACIDMDKMKSRSIPQAYREAFLALMEEEQTETP